MTTTPIDAAAAARPFRLPRAGAPLLALCAVAGFSALFVLFPQIDIAVSGLFHDPAQGFAASHMPGLKQLRKSSTWVMAVLLGLALWRLCRACRGAAGARLGVMRPALCVLAGLALGPGLLVNAVLKEWWGRPRPIQVDLFGGDAPFAAAWRITDACASNCSFVSGEASSAAWMAGAVLILAPGRILLASGVALYGAALSLNRLAFGGHFLSDILLAWAMTGLVLAILHRLTVAEAGRGHVGDFRARFLASTAPRA